MSVLVFSNKPQDFTPKVIVASCLLHCAEKFLFIKNAKAWPGLWNLPGGKAESGETPRQAVVREVMEELQLAITARKKVGHFYIKNPSFGDYEVHYFIVHFDSLPQIILSDEHSEARWLTQDEALRLDLIPGIKDSLGLLSLSWT